MSTPLLALGDARYVSLTTFRRSGVPVSTPVWVARDGDALVVTTHLSTGKAKRIRNSGRVEVAPCGMRGRVAPDAPHITGTAAIVTDASARVGHTRALAKKYGWQFRGFELVQRLAKSDPADACILRITG
ncbi:PPOX class F420-dependent oxidoreductase [Microbacteriaceae bacterium VKM Ac-2855]|nr:PPOX class F420-dependent oxidoreductase [Microbacteriaceae bacterium VKM Ac-2855]